jgi:hypothetical protein
MDLLFVLHLLIMALFASIPMWSHYYLKFGVYLPLLLSASWILFNGCPLTKAQTNLSSNSFTREVYKYVIPNISNKQTVHINTFLLLLITVFGFRRLCSIDKK